MFIAYVRANVDIIMGEELFDIPNVSDQLYSDMNNSNELPSPPSLQQDFLGRDVKPSIILEEFRSVYEGSLSALEGNISEDQKEFKLKLLTSWIKDLTEQNAVLIRTIEQVEQEALDRVSLLEDRLQKSSRIASDYRTKFQDLNNGMDVTLGNKFSSHSHLDTMIRMDHSDHNEILKRRICSLQNDISGLLEIIRRARYYGSWDASGLSFLELTYEDIFG